MGNKKINKEDWTKPLTSEEKRKYMVSIFIVALTIGLVVAMYMYLSDWDMSHRQKVYLSVNIGILPIPIALSLQYIGIPIFYKVDRNNRNKRVDFIKFLTLTAIYTNVIPLFIKLLKFEILPIHIYSAIIIQMIMMGIAAYNFFKLDERNKAKYKTKFIVLNLLLMLSWISRIQLVMLGQFII